MIRTAFHFAIAVFSLLFTARAAAQPVFTFTDFAPHTGDQYTVGHTGTYCAGSAGPGQTWNFSAISVATTETYTVAVASAVPCSNQYPLATQSIGLGGGFSMIDVNITEYLYYGTTITPGMPGFIYSDPELVLAYPLSFTDSYVDHSAAVQTTTSTVYRNGVDSVSYAGYGTIITPYGTYPNTICIRRHYSFVDSSQFGHNPCAMTFYYWFNQGYRYPVAQSWKEDVTCVGNGGTLFLQSIAIGMEEAASTEGAPKAFPNPLTRQFTLQTGTDAAGEPVIITDLSGRTVRTLQVTAPQMVIDLSGLDNGIYLLRVGNGTAIRLDKTETD